MGKKKTVKVAYETETFNDIEECPGVEVECIVGMSLDKYIQVGGMSDISSDERNPLERTVIFAGSAKEWADDVIVSWNLTYDAKDAEGNVEEKPLPANGTGFGMLPEAWSTAILKRWTDFIGSKATDAEKKESANGSSASSTRRQGSQRSRRSATPTRS